jgi:hypothetical protein
MYESYVKMKPNGLHDHLTRKLKMHPDAVKKIKEMVAARKEAKRKERITLKVLKKEWQLLMNPLRVELDNAKVGLKYKGTDTSSERTEAFEAYIKVLEELKNRLAMPSSRPVETPRQYARKLNANKKGSPITNDGEHWTDWVPPRIKQAVSDAFNDLPVKPSARRKVPFQRTVPLAQYVQTKESLLKRTQTERDNAERIWSLDPTDENAEMFTRICRAIDAVHRTQAGDVLPATWHGMEKFEGGALK